MILRVRLQNYASFGELQTAPLEPVTVIVGANNSGKTSFLRFVDFIRQRGNGFSPFFHRPVVGSQTLRVEWDASLLNIANAESPLEATYSVHATKTSPNQFTLDESISSSGQIVYRHAGPQGTPQGVIVDERVLAHEQVAIHADLISAAYFNYPEMASIAGLIAGLMTPVVGARHVHLSADALRRETQLTPTPTLSPEGAGLSALLAHWILEYPEKINTFNEIFTNSLPEMKRVHVTCENAGVVRLLFEQKDGERFVSYQVSDGVLVFAGLVAHALVAPPNALVLLEEPERAIHPRRLAALVDLLRTLTQERQTQFIMATHSPALLNELGAVPALQPRNGRSFDRLRDVT